MAETTKATHTPGEWKQIDADLMGIYIGVDGHDGDFLVLVHDSDFITVEEAQANARLISAAPDLLLALEAVVSLWHTMGLRDNDLHQAINKTIEKARGS